MKEERNRRFTICVSITNFKYIKAQSAYEMLNAMQTHFSTIGYPCHQEFCDTLSFSYKDDNLYIYSYEDNYFCSESEVMDCIQETFIDAFYNHRLKAFPYWIDQYIYDLFIALVAGKKTCPLEELWKAISRMEQHQKELLNLRAEYDINVVAYHKLLERYSKAGTDLEEKGQTIVAIEHRLKDMETINLKMMPISMKLGLERSDVNKLINDSFPELKEIIDKYDFQ